MPSVNLSRMTHQYEGDLVLFLIGMRINKPWRADLWLPVFRAMPGMLAELARDPDCGLLGSRLIFHPRSPWLVQYWNSVDRLYAYASNQEAAHRPAWTAFNSRARKAKGAVGIWHETFQVARAESIYVGMPPSGLGAATALVPVGNRSDRAAQRIAA
jgi:Monooxygenase af470-like